MKRVASVAVGLIVSLGVLLVLASPAAAHGPGQNGCSFVPDSGYFFDFHDVCDAHDLCYIQQPYGSGDAGRKQCDVVFYWDMANSCDAMWPMWHQIGAKAACKSVAYTYYVGVRWFGGFAWESGGDPALV